MRWIKEHKLISILIFTMIASFMVLLFSVLTSSSNNPVTRAVNSACATVMKPISSFADGVSDNISGIFKYKELQKENEELQKENDELKQQLINANMSKHELTELKNLSKALNYIGKSKINKFVTGDITSTGDSSWLNTFNVNVGSADGVKEDCIVICGKGLVGRVESVGKHWAKVNSIVDQNCKISFKIAGNLQLIGILDEFSNGSLSGFMLDSQAKVNEGDKIVTSGMGLFPSGLEVGKITKVKYDSNEQLQKVKVKPSVDFSSLQKVTVII